MGTSANRDRIQSKIPLLPDWILPPDGNPPEEDDDDQEQAAEENAGVEADNERYTEPEPFDGNRFNLSQRGFRAVVKGQSMDRGAITRVVKNYVTRAGGGSRTMARRMQRSSGAIVRLGSVLAGIQSNGLETTLRRLQLETYIGRPVLDVLSALINEVCGVGALLDDAITNQAYVNTVTRIDIENPGLDMENLNVAQIAEMLAIFLEETIVCRLICDIGRSLTTATTDVERSREMEETLYQVVNGLVHGEIVPRLEVSLQSVESLQQEMNTIYEITFSTIIQ